MWLDLTDMKFDVAINSPQIFIYFHQTYDDFIEGILGVLAIKQRKTRRQAQVDERKNKKKYNQERLQRNGLKCSIGQITSKHIKLNIILNSTSIDFGFRLWHFSIRELECYTNNLLSTWWFHFLYLYSPLSFFLLFIYRSTVRTNNIWLCRGFNYTRGIRTKVSLYIVWW